MNILKNQISQVLISYFKRMIVTLFIGQMSVICWYFKTQDYSTINIMNSMYQS